MFRRSSSENGLEVVASQQEEIARLRATNERLERLTATGSAAILAARIIDIIDIWVESGLDPTNPAGFAMEMDPAISKGMEQAARVRADEALAGLEPEKVIGLARHILSSDDFQDTVSTSLSRLFLSQPKEALASIDEDNRKSILGSVLDDPEKVEEFAKLLAAPTPEDENRPTMVTMQAEYDQFGYFDMRHLREGDRIVLEAFVKNDESRSSSGYDVAVKGIGRKVSDDLTFIQPLDKPIFPMDVPFTLLTDRGPDGRAFRVMPGVKTSIVRWQHEGFTQSNTSLKRLYKLSINGTALKLDESM